MVRHNHPNIRLDVIRRNISRLLFHLFLSGITASSGKPHKRKGHKAKFSADEISCCLRVLIKCVEEEKTAVEENVKCLTAQQQKWDRLQLLSFPATVIHPLMSGPWWNDSAFNQGRLPVCSLCQGQAEADQSTDTSCPTVRRCVAQWWRSPGEMFTYIYIPGSANKHTGCLQ